MNDKKQKKYIVPSAEIIQFQNDDIITFIHSDVYGNGWEGENWNGDVGGGIE